MNIILGSEVIHPGGAETFILRLAQALYKNGHDARVFVFYNELLNRELCKLIAPDVTIVPASIPANILLRKIDGLLFRLKIDFSIRNFFIKKSLKTLIKQHRTEVIHSHLLKVDALCLDVAGEKNIPVVNTIHGDYLQFFEKTRNNVPIPLLNYTKKAHSNLGRLSALVCISDKQIGFFHENFSRETTGKISKIYNGYTGRVTEDAQKLKTQLGISATDFVFGMVSRGIPDKGWQVAIDAFLQIGRNDTRLILTGQSEYLSSLQQKYAGESRIHFTGHADNPINWINIFDVGLLPSTYPSESLPTVIIEYMYCHVPVIASDAGEIVNMTGQRTAPAGIIAPVKEGKVNAATVAEAMQKYIIDKQLYEKHKENTALCYNMFDMNKCVDAYTDIYSKSINNTGKNR